MNWNDLKPAVEKLVKRLIALGRLDESQKKAVNKAVKMLSSHGVILADEVGLGKTRISLVIMEAVMRCGGTVAAVVPPGLMYQWEQEANKVFENFEDSRIKGNSVRLRKYENLFKNDCFPILKSNGDKWILASHNFGFLQRQTDNNENYDLFSLIKAKKDGWAKVENAIKKRNKKTYLEAAADYLLKDKDVCENPVWSVYQRPSGSYSLKDKIFVENTGKKLAYVCIRKLMGTVDLLVVDEAHKSREDESKQASPSKRLPNLLDCIIGRNKGARQQRRICMTATPIELSSRQWNVLLNRCMLPYFSGNDNCIVRFENAVKAAKINPENTDLLDKLIDASKQYGEELSKYVIRRNRKNNEDYVNLIKKLGLDEKRLNPHIDVNGCEILPEYLDNKTQGNWKKALYCFEGLSAACQGVLDIPQQTKLMRCRYASGLMDGKDLFESIGKLKDSNQKKRIQYWYGLAKKLTSDSDGKTDLYTHPRIKETAWAIWKEIKASREKILVFGTFKKPMLTLRNVLNAIYVIDCAIHNRPTSLMNLDKRLVHKVYNTFRDEFGKELKGRLSTFSLDDELRRCQNKNDSQLERLSRNFSDENICKELKLNNLDEEEKKVVGHRIRSDMVDALRSRKMNNRARKVSKELEQDVFKDICCAYNKGFTDQLKTYKEQACDDKGTKNASSRKAKLFDALGLNEQEEDEGDTSRRRSAFCRLMDGDMKMSTRRVVQELFNDENAFPKVLVAQSSVGREGLNLQGACRNIFIFHPEWNPAVIEQEIGRVDRIGSLWEKCAKEYKKSGGKPVPKISVTFVVFKGTYDEHQYKVYLSRKEMLSSQLSGVLLEDESDKISPDYKEKLENAAPDFESWRKNFK